MHISQGDLQGRRTHLQDSHLMDSDCEEALPRMSSEGKRVAPPPPDDIDFTPQKKPSARNYRDGVRSHINKGKEPNVYGYTLELKADIADEGAGQDLANRIEAGLTYPLASAVYKPAIPAEESQFGRAKEQHIAIKLFTQNNLQQARATCAKEVGSKLAATAGDWEVAARALAINKTADDCLALVGPVQFLDYMFIGIAEKHESISGSRNAGSFDFAFENDNDLGAWIVRQVSRLAESVGVVVKNNSGYCTHTPSELATALLDSLLSACATAPSLTGSEHSFISSNNQRSSTLHSQTHAPTKMCISKRACSHSTVFVAQAAAS